MIRFDWPQGSEEWVGLRVGRPTASNFDKVLTPKTLKLSGSFTGYAHQLIAEQILGFPVDSASSGFIERGSIMEKQAVDYYELQRECDTEAVGFILRDDERVGCSPDRFVGSDGLLEIKCPSAAVHVGYLLDTEGIGYKAQVQGQLWICERNYCDTLSYNPEMPAALVRQQRDEKFIAALAAAVEQLLSYIDESKLKLMKLGLFPGEKIPALRIA